MLIIISNGCFGIYSIEKGFHRGCSFETLFSTHFCCRQDDLSAQEGIGAWVNYFSQQATAYLPTHMNELMLREKSVAIARLPISDTKTAVAMPR